MSKLIRKTQKIAIISNKEVCSAHFVMELEAPFLGENSAPGQFINIRVDEGTTDPLLRIPLGIHKIHEGGISLLYKVVGSGTQILSNKKQGDQVDVLGPLGKGFDVARVEAYGNTPLQSTKQDPEAILVAGGHGIAPLYALAESLAEKKIKTTFLIGVRSRDHLVCVDELKSLGAEVQIATEDGSAGYEGYVTELLEELLKQVMKGEVNGDSQRARFSRLRSGQEGQSPGEQQTMIYSCGPRLMLRALSKVALENNTPAQVSLDAYMACGVGACLGCAVKTKDGYKMVCKDGPVFDSKEILWT